MNTRQGTYVRTDTHRAMVLPGCRGGCNQGRSVCDCDTELQNAIPLRPEFPAPKGKKMNTRRYPRSLVQAFGPYTDNRLHPMPDTTPTWLERLLAWFTGMAK